MIKTKLHSIVNAREAMRKLAGQELPVQESYRVAKLIKAMNAEIAIYDEARIKLCEKYGELAENKREYTILKGAEFNRELSSLLDMEVELDLKKVTLPLGLCITPSDVISLSDFVEIEGVEDD